VGKMQNYWRRCGPAECLL